jgi:hypothetical protein
MGRVQSLTVTKEDVDLGDTSFKKFFVINYVPDGRTERLQLKCVDFEVVIPVDDPDLSLIDKNTLRELLVYVENCNDLERLGPLETSLLDEIARRNRI